MEQTSKPIDRFCETATAFSVWCTSPPGHAIEEARKALEFFRSLQYQAEWLKIPEDFDTRVNGERCNDALWKEVFERAGCLPFNHYEIEPKTKKKGRGKGKPEKGKKGKTDSVVPVADLADDIADVFRDLSEGLSLYTGGHLAEAEWAMRHSYDTHWGEHAREACKVLSLWLGKHG